MEKIKLITTKTCPKCNMVKRELSDLGIEYEVVEAEDNLEYVKTLDIYTVPALLVEEVNKPATLYADMAKIYNYLKARRLLSKN